MERTFRNKSALRFGAVAAVCLIMAAALVGCAGKASSEAMSDEDQCRKAVSAELDPYKSVDGDMVQGICDKTHLRASTTLMSGTDKEMEQLVIAWFDGFDYEVSDVEIGKADTATATVVVTGKKLNPTMDAGREIGSEAIRTGTANTGGATDEYINKQMIKAVEEAEPETIETTVKLVKSDGEWKVSQSGMSKFYNDLLGR